MVMFVTPGVACELLMLNAPETLITAIFAMIAHGFLTGRATKILEEIDEFGVKLIDLLAARKYKHSTERGGE